MSWRDAYLENQVLTANPMELLRMLYQAAIDSIRAAREHLAAGDIIARANAINRAQAIIGELDRSLDHNVAGGISRSLAELYGYVRQRLTEGNLRQKDAPLGEAERLLETLYEAWKQSPQPIEGGAVGATAPPALLNIWSTCSPGEAHTWSA